MKSSPRCAWKQESEMKQVIQWIQLNTCCVGYVDFLDDSLIDYLQNFQMWYILTGFILLIPAGLFKLTADKVLLCC